MTIEAGQDEPSDQADVHFLRASGVFDTPWFLSRNQDLVAAGLDALLHFHRFGWREARWPNAYFDTSWYLRYNQDVADSGIDPLLHYARYGEAEGRKPIAYFEPAWYRRAYRVPPGELCLAHFLRHRSAGAVSPVPEFDTQFYLQSSPDVADAGMDPFEHYLVTGAAEDRAPSPGFDVRFYRARYLQHLPGENPLLHYRRHRHEPGVFPTPEEESHGIPQEIGRNTRPGQHFEEFSPVQSSVAWRAKLLAFYLPQFHPMPENDRWWGTGFTEWTNVARGVPRFAGHYQPRIPRDLGHYRLEGTGTLAKQVAMAQAAGLHGFVFYFYWFNGRRLLETPLETYLSEPALQMPFCLMWANENWTRRWDGSEQEVLLSQDYRDQDEPALIATFARYFDDPRYIRCDGRPLLMIYRAGLIPSTAEAIARWRRKFAEIGHNPLFVMAQSFSERDPRAYGMDAAVEFPPHKLTEGLPLLNATLRMLDHRARGQVFAYDDLAAASDLSPQPYPLIRTALPGWDNDARREGQGMTLHGATPGAFEAWLLRLIEAARAQPVFGDAFVCINAWNEWAEGAYLEPDVHFGAAFLNAAARAVAGSSGSRSGTIRVMLVGHDAFPAGAQLLLLHLGRQFRKQGAEVAFLLMGGGVLEAAYRAAGTTSVFDGPVELAEHAAVLRKRGFDAALVNTSGSGWAANALAAHGISCTMLVHEMPRLLRERGLIESARAGVTASTNVIFATPYVRDRFCELINIESDKATLLPQGLYRPIDAVNGSERRSRLRIPPDATLAVGLGYADLRKGFDLFLQVWRLARGVDSTIHLLWIGDLDPIVSAYLGAEVAAASATGTFHHLGFEPEGADWLAAADVHLLTSREDPFPSVVLEAMSAGVPTVAFEEAGSIPDLLRECKAGVAVPLGDAAAMVRALRALALQRDDEERARLARTVRQRFSFEAYSRTLLDLLSGSEVNISACVINHNYARFLPGRLRSVFSQTLQPREILVLDDVSKDGSEVVARETARKFGREIAWLSARRRLGVFSQWRRAVERSRGEFVWIAEADDEAEPDLLEKVYRLMQSATDCQFGFADSKAFDEAGQTLWPDHKAYYRELGSRLLAKTGVIPAGVFLREGLGARNLVLNASAVVWRRKALSNALERAKSELPGLQVAGDWLIYAESLVQGGSVAYVAEPLNRHRRHAVGVTARLPAADHLDEIKFMHRHMRRLLGEDVALKAEQRRALAAARRALHSAD